MTQIPGKFYSREESTRPLALTINLTYSFLNFFTAVHYLSSRTILVLRATYKDTRAVRPVRASWMTICLVGGYWTEVTY